MEGRAPGGPSRQDLAARAQWRRPLIAAFITVVLMSLVILIGYQRMRDDARHDAAASRLSPPVKQAAANGPGGASGAAQRPPAVPGGAAQSH
jgi:hypothetical protein